MKLINARYNPCTSNSIKSFSSVQNIKICIVMWLMKSLEMI